MLREVNKYSFRAAEVCCQLEANDRDLIVYTLAICSEDSGKLENEVTVPIGFLRLLIDADTSGPKIRVIRLWVPNEVSELLEFVSIRPFSWV
jgi:hypothetical protein